MGIRGKLAVYSRGLGRRIGRHGSRSGSLRYVCAVVGPWELLVLRGGGEVLAISARERRGSKAQINYK